MLEAEGRLKKLTSVWLRKIEQARIAREPFRKTADICRNFYQGSCGFMWEEGFRNKYFANLPAPRFKLTIAKAFELVAITAPSLYWDYPGRTARPYARLNIQPDVFGDPNDPAVQQAYNDFIQRYESQRRVNSTRCSLMEQYLNYSQREQPNGGLVAESRLAITEALITGRGCLWTESYKYPGSERVLTRSVFDSCLRLFIDPQCTKPNLSDCGWIARQHIDDYWDVERRFNLPEGSLKNATSASVVGSADSVDFGNSTRDEYHTLKMAAGGNENKIVWYEIFSRVGVGTRLERFDDALHQAFETVVGDFAYICVAKNVNFPLNFPPSTVNEGDDAIRAALDWPVPIYRDNRWPVSILDFYEAASGPWPLAPVAMGLGELIFLNVIMSCLCDRVYMNSRNIWAVLKEAGDDIMRQIKSDDFNLVLELNGQIHQNVKELVSMIESPPVNFDVFRMIDYVSMLFDKRTGLSDSLYGMNVGGKVARTAADINFKEAATSVRPDWMARRVEDWQTSVANIERIYAGWSVQGKDLVPLFGPDAAQLWDSLISDEDPEVYVREMNMTVEANSIRKPNKFRDNENLARLAQYLIPELSRVAQQGDPSALNAFIKSLGDAMEQDVTEWLVPTPPPPPQQQPEMPPPQEMMPEQQMQEMPPEMEQMPPEAMMPEQMPVEAGPDIPMSPELMAAMEQLPPEMLMEF